MKYYAFKTEESQGIVETWEECSAIVKNRKAKFKKFSTKELATSWLNNNCTLELPEGIYFDAGTGGGYSEYRVTNNKGKSILDKANERGNKIVEGTNNYGELLALNEALKIALKTNVKNIYGDSKLVLEYWSKGFINQTLPSKTIELANETKALREKFESLGGTIEHISGDINPADLGYH